MAKYLTKSKFKIGLECPTKLFYEGQKDKYYNAQVDDTFLQALAEGGFQVGELAKLYYPQGVEVETLEHNEALELTANLLKQENVIIYEAAFSFKNLFIRTDIIVKTGNHINIIEVKAKSIDVEKDKFLTRGNTISSAWRPYLYDIAFQKHVVINARPDFELSASLLLADKTARTTVEGLNQKFLLARGDKIPRVILSGDISKESLGEKILIEVNVDTEIDTIFKFPTRDAESFESLAALYSDSYVSGTKLDSLIGGKCSACQYRIEQNPTDKGLISGFHECWKEKAHFKDADFEKPQLLELWDFRKKDEYLSQNKFFLEDLTREDLESKVVKATPHLSRVDRQELQIKKRLEAEPSRYIDIEGLRTELAKWKYPLHFIDFETTTVAIPFNKGRRPYEQVAFQFSHHIVHENGEVDHIGEWINTDRGLFPNFSFIRALKQQLEQDEGTIFRYAAHENTILNAIYVQLLESTEPDKEVLCTWIKTITKSKSTLAEKWEGPRNMVDLRDLVLKYYYHPLMKGSNSIKQVLYAIINDSDYIRAKYGKPTYGREIKSNNFSDHIWITYGSNGLVINLYELLKPIHEGNENEDFDNFFFDEDGVISDGGAAMIAYAKMQFSEMDEIERKNVSEALLRYCELDTFAMVIIFEAWNNWCKK